MLDNEPEVVVLPEAATMKVIEACFSKTHWYMVALGPETWIVVIILHNAIIGRGKRQSQQSKFKG